MRNFVLLALFFAAAVDASEPTAEEVCASFLASPDVSLCGGDGGNEPWTDPATDGYVESFGYEEFKSDGSDENEGASYGEARLRRLKGKTNMFHESSPHELAEYVYDPSVGMINGVDSRLTGLLRSEAARRLQATGPGSNWMTVDELCAACGVSDTTTAPPTSPRSSRAPSPTRPPRTRPRTRCW